MRNVAVLVCVATVVAVGCGEEARLDTRKIERGIARGIESRNGGLDVTVRCPDEVTRETGGTFTCRVVSRDGQEAKALVKQLDDSGRVRYGVPSPPWRK